MYPDVEKTKWYADAIKKASAAGIMIGDDQGNFRPKEPLTRAEAAVVVCRLLDRIEATITEKTPPAKGAEAEEKET